MVKTEKPARRPSNSATRKSAPMPARSAAGGARAAKPSPALPSSITIRGFRGSSGVRPLSHHPFRSRLQHVKDGTVNAKRLCRRIFALMGALKDLPRQAKRLALWLAKPVEERRPRRERPLRFGWPPGWRDQVHPRGRRYLEGMQLALPLSPTARHVVRQWSPSPFRSRSSTRPTSRRSDRL